VIFELSEGEAEMSRLSTNHTAALGATLVLLLAAPLSAQVSTVQKRDSITKMSTARQSKDSTDHHFVLEASVGGLTEVRLGKMAQRKAASQKVKDLGEKMVTDHSKANDELAEAAKKDGIQTAETKLEDKQKGQIDRLSGLSGKEFDSAYLRTMLRDHQEDVQKFQEEAKSGQSQHVKDFASKTLPTLEKHLAMVEKLAKSMGVDTTVTSSSASQ
jgi:putative membrane protein